MTAHDFEDQLQQIDENILNALAERKRLYDTTPVSDQSDLDDMDIVSGWLEEGADRGLDDELLEKLAKIVVLLSKKRSE